MRQDIFFSGVLEALYGSHLGVVWRQNLRSLPVDPSRLTGPDASAVARRIFCVVTDALFTLVLHIYRSVGHPTRPANPLPRQYLPPPWKPVPT